MSEFKALIPTIKWSQNNDYITVNLEINQVKNDVYELNTNNIVFTGLCNTNLTYSINIELLNEINKDESKYIVEERIVRFILKKTSDEKWIRLTKDKNQYKSNIKVNWDDFEDSDEEEDMVSQDINQQNQQFDLSSMMGNNGFNMEEMMKNMDPSQIEQLMKSMNMGDDNDEYQDKELEDEINNITNNDDEDYDENDNDSIDSDDLCKECA